MSIEIGNEIQEHPESWVAGADLGRTIPPYRKTFPFPGDFIDEFHHALVEMSSSGRLVTSIKGSLRPADALKLYELAYYSDGSILEIGSYRGLSAWVIASAIKNSGRKRDFISFDINATTQRHARTSLSTVGLAEYVTFRTSDGTLAIETLAAEGRRFSFAFIDHSHTYEHVLAAAIRLPRVLEDPALVLFHDFNDPRNVDDAYPDYGVFPAVLDAQKQVPLEFLGVYGCAGLFRFSPN